MNTLLEELRRDGTLLLPSGERTRVHSGVGAQSGAVLRRAVELSAPKLGCEVGLAYGISSLYILDAMKEFGGGELIGMDPAQHDATWQGAGLYNIERAGFSGHYRFHEAPSQLVLPKLAYLTLCRSIQLLDSPRKAHASSSASSTAGTPSITRWWTSSTST